MKKLLLLGLAFIITPAFAVDFTPDSSMCIQVTQHAVSPKGVCETFSTPCDVPETWKIISSCDLVKPKGQNTRFQDVVNRRKMARIKRIQEMARDQEENPVQRRMTSQPRFVGRALYTKRRGTENVRLHKTQGGSFLDNRSTTALPDRNNEEAYARFKEVNEGLMPGLSQEGEMTKVQKFQQNILDGGDRRPGWETSTQMKRTGYLTLESYFTQRAMKQKIGSSRHWRELHPGKRPKFTQKVRSGRSGWRGDRMEGDLGGSVRD